MSSRPVDMAQLAPLGSGWESQFCDVPSNSAVVMTLRRRGTTIDQLQRDIGCVSRDSAWRILTGKRPLRLDEYRQLRLRNRDIPDLSTQKFWATDHGIILPCPNGHDAMIAATVVNAPGFDAEYGMRNMGWIELTLRSDRSILIRYHERGISQEASVAAAKWIMKQQPLSIVRSVQLSDSWADSTHPSIESAADALLGAYQIARPRFVVRWNAEPLHFNSAQGTLARLLKTWHSSAHSVMPAAEDFGLLSRCALLKPDQGSFRLLYLGSELRVPRNNVGKLLGERSDLGYAQGVHADLAEVLTLQTPTLKRISATAFGETIAYERVLIPTEDKTILSHSRAIPLEAA